MLNFVAKSSNMKQSHVIALIMLIIAAVIFISASNDVSSYATFASAQESGSRVKVVGELVKSKEIVYNPSKNPNYFSFYMKDDEGSVKKVVLKEARPQDFELSESIVVTGVFKDNEFAADEILLKCPSKYNKDEITLRKSG